MSTRRVVLSNPTSSLVLECIDSHLPWVVHWGAPLGELTGEQLDDLTSPDQHEHYHNGLPDQVPPTAIVPEQWSGWMGHPGVSGHRGGGAWAPKFEVVSFELDGQPVDELTSAEAGTVQVVARDEVAGLELRLQVELGVGGIRQRAELVNLGEDDYQLDQLLLCLPVPRRASEVLDLCGRWGKERVPQRTSMGVGAHWRESRHGRTAADAATMLHLGEPGFGFREGEVWAVHTAWSGNHVHYAEQVWTGDQVIGGGELLLPGEMVLAPGASYTSPWVHFVHGEGLDAIARQNHAFIRATHPVSADRPVTLNVWEAVYFDHDAERLIDLAHRAQKLGIERFVLDDGWFGSRRDDHSGLGDWVVSPDVWPNGLHPLVDKVRELGMEFGLWFEPEMVNPDSDLARAHPEWVMQVPGRMPLTSRNQWVLNLSVPGAYAHVRDQMMALLEEYEIGYIKWDMNRDHFDSGTAPGGQAAVRQQTLAFYRLVDELKAAHPGLEIESCSSGGGRIDLEVMQHCDRVWVSDNIDPTDRQQMMRWTAQLLPPEMLGSHIASGASHTTWRHHDINYRAATAVFGHLGVEWDLAKATDEELAALGAWIDWYKQNRAVLNGGELVRGDVADAGCYLHGVVTEQRAIYAWTTLELPPVYSIGRLRLPGLDPDASYRVTHLDLTLHGAEAPEAKVLTGRQLATIGLRAPNTRPERTRILVLDRV